MIKKILFISVLFIFTNTIFAYSQLKEEREFYFNKEKNDTLKYTDIDKTLELLALDTRLHPAYFSAAIKINGLMTTYRNKGTKLTPQLLSVFEDEKKEQKFIWVETIVVMRNGKENHYKGFKVYLKD